MIIDIIGRVKSYASQPNLYVFSVLQQDAAATLHFQKHADVNLEQLNALVKHVDVLLDNSCVLAYGNQNAVTSNVKPSKNKKKTKHK